MTKNYAYLEVAISEDHGVLFAYRDTKLDLSSKIKIDIKGNLTIVIDDNEIDGNSISKEMAKKIFDMGHDSASWVRFANKSGDMIAVSEIELEFI